MYLAYITSVIDAPAAVTVTPRVVIWRFEGESFQTAFINVREKDEII